MQDTENRSLTPEPADDSSRPPAVDSGAAGKRNSRLVSLFFNDRGLRAGWRLLSWLAVCFVLLQALISAYRPVSRHVPRDFSQDVSRLLTVVAILGGTALMARLEHRSPWSYGLADGRWRSHFFSGVLIGWLSLTVMLAGMRVADHFYFGSPHMLGAALAAASALYVLSFLFGVALFEEILFRGYALNTLAEGIGFWPASILLSILFAAAHLNNGGEAKVGIVAVVVFGLMLCFSLWRTGSLLWAIGFHFMWDYAESFLYGVPDSGIVQPDHWLSATFVGPAWITGGTVGPEGSWFIFPVLAAVGLAIHGMYPERHFSFPPSGDRAIGVK